MITPEEQVAKAFHDTYERLAPQHNYHTRRASAKPWEDVPENNRSLMIEVVSELRAEGVIVIPEEGMREPA